MKLSQLRNLLAIAEKGSIRSAARHLKVAQPALSRSMQELEHELGVSLFERGAKGIALTSMGQRFLARAQTIQSEVRRAQEEICQLMGKTDGSLYVCLSVCLSVSRAHIALFPYALKAFRARYPDVVLDIMDGGFPSVAPLLKSGARSPRDLIDAEWVTTSITHEAAEELGPLFAQFTLPPPRLVLAAHSALIRRASMHLKH